MHFTDYDRELIDLLPIGRHLTDEEIEDLRVGIIKPWYCLSSTEIVYKVFDDEIPRNAQKIVIARLRALSEKAEEAQVPWRLRKTSRCGNYPQIFWRERVKRYHGRLLHTSQRSLAASTGGASET